MNWILSEALISVKVKLSHPCSKQVAERLRVNPSFLLPICLFPSSLDYPLRRGGGFGIFWRHIVEQSFTAGWIGVGCVEQH